MAFNNGRRKIIFAQPPKCEDLDTYDQKYFPSVLVSAAAGDFKETGFNKLRGYVTDPDSGLPVEITGGIFHLNLNFTIYALNKGDRNNLADLVGSYLSKRDTKLAFLQSPFGYMLGMPTFSGDNVEDDPQTNVKIFSTVISMPLQTDFEDISQVADQFGNIGLTVRDIVSLIASHKGTEDKIDPTTGKSAGALYSSIPYMAPPPETVPPGTPVPDLNIESLVDPKTGEVTGF